MRIWFVFGINYAEMLRDNDLYIFYFGAELYKRRVKWLLILAKAKTNR